jgi:hypothetical protein
VRATVNDVVRSFVNSPLQPSSDRLAGVRRGTSEILAARRPWLYSENAYAIGVRVQSGKILVNLDKPPSDTVRSHTHELACRVSSHNGAGVSFELLGRNTQRRYWDEIVVLDSRFTEALLRINGERYVSLTEYGRRVDQRWSLLARLHPSSRCSTIFDATEALVPQAFVPQAFGDIGYKRLGQWYFQPKEPEAFVESLVVTKSPVVRNGELAPGVALFDDNGFAQRRYLEPEFRGSYGDWRRYRADEMYLDEHVYVKGHVCGPRGSVRFTRWHLAGHIHAADVTETP